MVVSEMKVETLEFKAMDWERFKSEIEVCESSMW